MIEFAIDALLDPISAEPPCGPDLQYDPAYDSIRLARQVKNQQLPAGVWEKEEKDADWNAIARNCSGLLQGRTKDLQVAAWLTESWVHSYGLAGLRAGLELVDRLSNRYWDDVHPMSDDGDWSNRLRAFEWVGRELPGWLKTHLWNESPDASSAHRESTESILHSLTSVQGLLESKLGEAVVSVNDSVKRLRAQLTRWEEMFADSDAAPKPFRSTVASRADAYEQLRAVAEYLARHEPHSPVPEMLRAMSGWQNYEFGDLLTLLPANGPSVYDLARLFTLTKGKT